MIQPIQAAELVKWLGDNHVTARAFGSAAIAGIADYKRFAGIDRLIKDVDLVMTSECLRQAIRLFNVNDWEFDKRSIAFNDLRRVTLRSKQTGLMVDLFSDPLEFNQRVEIGRRLSLKGWHLWPSDLLALKLQIHELRQNDSLDIAVLLAGHKLGTRGPGTIEISRLQHLAEQSWTFFYAARLSLEKVRVNLDHLLPNREIQRMADRRLRRLEELIEPENPSASWRMRAHLGTHVAWYNDVNE